MEAIRTENLTKKYKELTAVDSLTLSVQEGELFSLLGVNGAGKTTTIKMLSCLTRPTSGDAFIFGNSVKNTENEVKKIIAVSPQESAYAPNLTVRENLQMIAEIFGFSRRDAVQKAVSLMEAFALTNKANTAAKKLSGGYQRRLSIAMALISEPRVLFLDEPTLGLDVIARQELWDVIQELKSRMTIILTTHYMEEAEALSDRIGVMKDGELLYIGTTADICRRTGTDSLEKAFVALVKETK